MKLAISLLSFTAIFPIATPIRADDPASMAASKSTAIQYRLTKLVYQRAQRTTFRLEIDSERKGLHVTAVCDLRMGGKGLGRFPLEQTVSRENSNARSFRISCLHDDVVEDTVIQVLVRDDATGKSVDGARIRLKDAMPAADRKLGPAAALPDIDEASATGQ